MVAIVLVTLLNPWSVPTEEPVVCGKAKYYSPELMDEVASNRGLNTAGYVGIVALMPRGDLGREVWLEKDGRLLGPYLVVDCAQRKHYNRRVRQGDVAEVSFEQATMWNMTGPEEICVWFALPAHRWN